MNTSQIATPVASFTIPSTLADLAEVIESLTATHGGGLQIRQYGSDFIIFTEGAFCNCATCLQKVEDFQSSYLFFGMIVCSLCGNKRCPHATSHKFACTESNESGQEAVLLPEYSEVL